MKRFVPILALLMTSTAIAQTLRVAVIDSGLNIEDTRLKDHLCSTGHKDFTGFGLKDTNGHGTAMVGLIEKYAGTGDYCLLIYKYYSSTSPGSVNLKNEVDALQEVYRENVKIVNLSGGGPEFNEKEYLAIRTNPETTFVVAAGNEGKDLDIPGNEFFPASYYQPNELVIGNVDQNNQRVSSSNYGKKVTAVEIGENVRTTSINGYAAVTGTSASTAIFTGKLIRKILDANK